VISTNVICPNCRRQRESLVFVVVLVVVIGNEAIEDEGLDSLIAAQPRCAVWRVSNVADPGPEQSQRDCGLQPKVGVQRLPWVRVPKSNQRQRRCGRGQALVAVRKDRMGRNRVAVADVGWTMTQGSSCLATLGFGTESRWDSPTERDPASRSRFASTEMVGCFRRIIASESAAGCRRCQPAARSKFQRFAG